MSAPPDKPPKPSKPSLPVASAVVQPIIKPPERPRPQSVRIPPGSGTTPRGVLPPVPTDTSKLNDSYENPLPTPPTEKSAEKRTLPEVPQKATPVPTDVKTESFEKPLPTPPERPKSIAITKSGMNGVISPRGDRSLPSLPTRAGPTTPAVQTPTTDPAEKRVPRGLPTVPARSSSDIGGIYSLPTPPIEKPVAAADKPTPPERQTLPVPPASDKPTPPERPTLPERPVLPARPEIAPPEKPPLPEKPTIPEKPTRPEIPQKPSLPARPEPPKKPELPGRDSPTSLSGEGKRFSVGQAANDRFAPKDSNTNRMATSLELEKHLSIRLQKGASPFSSPPPLDQTPPSPPTQQSPANEKKKSSSKLARPTTKKKNKAARVYGTLPKLIGGSSSSSNSSKDSQQNQQASQLTNPQVPSGVLHVSDPGSLPSLESPSQTPTPSNTTPEAKWKRGAEAEAILKLLEETKELIPEAKNTSKNEIPTEVAANFLDASAIMKILGLEEPGIKLPEKHTDGDEKALDPISELQLTERNFIADLGLLNETFVKQVRENHCLPLNILSLMELNLDRLISLHRELYKNFLDDSSLLGLCKTFNSGMIFQLERIYSVYMGHYEQAIEVFYEKRDNVTQFRKYLKQRETFTDKSIPNLLVTPVQRVCKYELMLKSINKTVMKTADPNDQELQEHSNQLNKVVDELNIALQNIDKKRAAADSWDKICELESNLLLSEPLTKPGRSIILQIDTPIKTREPEQLFKLILFNDVLVRTKMTKKAKKVRLLDTIPLKQLEIISLKNQSPNTQGGSVSTNGNVQERFSFYLINEEPRSDIWTVTFISKADKKTWKKSIFERIKPREQFCKEWKIPVTEKLLIADSCRWPQEFVNECRIYVTSNYLCILWKLFGTTERELVPLSTITNYQILGTGKDRSIKCTVSNWKQDYTFTSLQNIDQTDQILSNAISQVKNNKSPSSSSLIPIDTNPFILSNSEWDVLWTAANSTNYSPKSLILQSSRPTNVLFKLVKGLINVQSADGVDKQVQQPGTIFGVSNFIGNSEVAQDYKIFTGDNEVTVLQLNREIVFNQLPPENLIKFFASLSTHLDIL